MIALKYPCKDCQCREIGCHAKCSAYLDKKAEFDKSHAKAEIEWSRNEDQSMRLKAFWRSSRHKIGGSR